MWLARCWGLNLDLFGLRFRIQLISRFAMAEMYSSAVVPKIQSIGQFIYLEEANM